MRLIYLNNFTGNSLHCSAKDFNLFTKTKRMSFGFFQKVFDRFNFLISHNSWFPIIINNAHYSIYTYQRAKYDFGTMNKYVGIKQGYIHQLYSVRPYPGRTM